MVLDNQTGNEAGGTVAGTGSKGEQGFFDILDAANEETQENETENSDESDDESTSESTGESSETEDQEEEGSEEDSEAEEEQVEETKEEVVEEEENEELTASFGNLRKKYPQIFKDFPGLRNKLGREYAFSEVFPTVDDAKGAARKAEIFDYFDKEAYSNPTILLNAIPNAKAAEKFAENILPALRQIHPDLFTKAVDPYTRFVLNKVAKDGEAAGDKNLVLAAKHLGRYLFGEYKVPDLPTRQVPQNDPEKEELRNQLSQAQQQQYSQFENAVTSSVNRTLSKEAKLILDPKDSLSPKVQSVWINQILEEVDNELSANSSHMAQMRTLQDKALKSRLSEDHKSRLLSAYLSRARPLLKQIAQRIQKEAFGKSKAPVNQDQGKKVIPQGLGKANQSPNKVSKVNSSNVKNFKRQGGTLEQLLGD